MSHQSFTPQLTAAPDKPLRFTVDGKKLVPNDFHVTEIKKVSIDSLDCGGGASAWNELVIQLWSPDGDDAPAPMTAGKFSSILAKADALPLLDGEHVRFEYAAVGKPSVQYRFDGVRADGNALEIELVAPYVACKLREQRQLQELSIVGASSCCVPGADTSCCA